MGALFGGYLAERNEVYLVDVDANRVNHINAEGVRIREQDGTEKVYHPVAVTETAGLPAMDLVIVFVKAMYTESALEGNRGLIGPDTYLMTLQNGTGHEAKLLKFADRGHVVIGTTQHNSSLLGGRVCEPRRRREDGDRAAGRWERAAAGDSGGVHGEWVYVHDVGRGEGADLEEAVFEHGGEHADGDIAGAAGVYTGEPVRLRADGGDGAGSGDGGKRRGSRSV